MNRLFQSKPTNLSSSKIFICFIVMLIIMCLFLQTAYADDNTSGTTELPSRGGFNGAELQAGQILTRLGVTGGALALAYSGVEYGLGDAQRAEKAKSRMILIGVATASLLVLPTVINAALDLFAATGWNP